MCDTHKKFTILQYNVQKSYTVMNLLLRDKKALEYDVLAIQEPWLNDRDSKMTHNPTRGRFHTFMSTSADRPLVCFFVNSRIAPDAIRVTSRGQHLCSLHIAAQMEGESQDISIHNIYNPHLPATLPRFTEGRWDGIWLESVLPHLDTALTKSQGNPQVVVGDFNLHHEVWYGETTLPSSAATRRTEAEALLTLMSRHGLELALEPGTVTRPRQDVRSSRAGSTIDLTWATGDLEERIGVCKVRPDLDFASDHMPILTSFYLQATLAPPKLKRQFRKLDAQLLTETLRNCMPPIGVLETSTDMDTTVDALTAALQNAIERAIPASKVTAQSMPGFTAECRDAIDQVKRTQRQWKRTGLEDDLIEFQQAKQCRKSAIQKANRDLHREKVSAVRDEKDLWSLAKWARNRGARSVAFTPDLEMPDGTLTDDTQAKAKVFQDTFFPTPPEADLADIPHFRYNQPAEGWVPITEHEIREAFRDIPLDKAPGPDEIPHRVLKAVLEVLAEPLTMIFNRSVQLSYVPRAFKQSITAVLRKAGKDDYSKPKSYRPIALMNTLGKILDTVMARRIQYMAEKHSMLPHTHTGGRKLVSCEHAIHLVLEKVHTAWRKQKVASLLLLDVSGAFDNVSHTRLFHNLQKRGLPPEIIRWITSYLQDRTSQIKLAEGISNIFNIHTGVPQGSPLSPILYLFYNADLLEIGRSQDLVTGYIDDTALLVTANTVELATAKLQLLHERCDLWARRHASVFAHQKYELLHFVHQGDRRKIKDKQRPLDLGFKDGKERIIQPTNKARYLGVILDDKLSGTPHIAHIKESVTKSIQALQSISGSTWGVSMDHMLKLVKAVIIPRILFACSVWYLPTSVKGTTTRRAKMIAELSALQKKALCVATGAFRTTAGAVLEAETGIPPIKEQLLRAALISTVRIKGSPLHRPMRALRERGDPRFDSTRISALQRLELIACSVLGAEAFNTIEAKSPTVVPPWWKPPDSRIASDAETAVQEHNALKGDNPAVHAQIYTDGSDIKGRVGAAVWYAHQKWSCKYDIGPSSQFTVYGAELLGIWGALRITTRLGRRIKQVTIFTDNQAAIQSTVRPRNQSGQVILREISQLVDVLHSRGIHVTLRWIPAHVGVAGNERADLLAKQATGWSPRDQPGVRGQRLAWMPQLMSACKRTISEHVRTIWESQWPRKAVGARYRSQHGSLLNRKTPQLYQSLDKAQSSVLIQMRTEKIGLNSYLYRIKRADDSWCPCRNGYHTVTHIIGECQLFWRQRKAIFGHRVLTDPLLTISSSKLITKAVTLMLATGHLDQFSRYRDLQSGLNEE